MKVNELIQRLNECNADAEVFMVSAACGEHSISGFEVSTHRVHLSGVQGETEYVNGCYNCEHDGCNEKCSTCELGKTKFTQYRKISNWEPKQ